MALAKNLSFILLGEDKSASSSMNKVQSTAEKVTSKVGGAFEKLGGIIGGEFGDVLEKAGAGIEELGTHQTNLSTKLTIGGGVIAGVGLALQQMGAKDKQASDELANAVKNTGHSFDAYEKQIEEAVSTGENFNHNAVDTQSALTKLTNALGSPSKALKEMSLVTDLAASKHISLAQSADLVVKILAGKGQKTLTAYGITMEPIVNTAKNLATAQDRVTKASATMADAQENLKLIQEVLSKKTKLTVADHARLEKAQYSVAKAAGVLATAQDGLSKAEAANKKASTAATDAADKLAKKLKGSASASVNNFGDQVQIVITKVTDWANKMANDVGPAVSVFGTVVGVAGTALQFYESRQAAVAEKAVLAQAALADEAIAMTAVDVASDANPIGAVAIALGAIGAVLGGGILANQVAMTKNTKDYTQALIDSNGVIDKSIRATETKKLVDDGVLATYVKLGGAASDAVGAALGEVGARKRVNEVLDAQRGKYAGLRDMYGTARTAVDVMSASQQKLKGHVDKVSDAISSQSATVKKNIASAKLYADGFGTTAEKAAAAIKSLDGFYAKAEKIAGIKGINVAVVGSITRQEAPTKKPHAAVGAIVSRPTTLIAGESGPEAIVPLTSGRTYPGLSGAGGGSAGVTQNITINMGGMVGTKDELAKTIVTTLKNAAKRGTIPNNAVNNLKGS